MQIETYECSETATETTDESEAASALLEKLGMSAQIEQANGAARFPFREMTGEEIIVYSQICPTKVKAEEYKQSPVPLRVLKCIDLCSQFPKSFDYIEIWDKVSAEIKDPIAVAVKEGENSWNKTYYMLARWGSELEPYSVLLKKVRESLIKSTRDRMQSIADMAISSASRIENMTLEKLANPPCDYTIRSF